MTTRFEYINELFPEDDVLLTVKKSIQEHDMPPISVSPDLGRLLTLLVRTSGSQSILEIGALGGYSGICLARGLPEDGKIISLELKAEFANVAKENLKRAALDHMVTYMLGEARDSLQKLKEENHQFDLIFIDADKPNYPIYLSYAIELSHSGTLIIADNVLLNDRVCDSANTSPSPTAMREFNRQLAWDPRLDSVLLPIHDGFAIARVW